MSPTKIFISTGLLILLCSGLAYGSSWYRLAYSKKMGAEVLVDQTSGNWCKGIIAAKIKLESNSPLLQSGIESFLKKVCSVIQKDCSSAKSVRFDIYNDDGKTLVSSYTSSSSKNWDAQLLEVKGKSLDDLPELSKTTTSYQKPAIDNIQPIRAKYLNLVLGVMPSSQEVLAKDSSMVDYLKLRHCKEYALIQNNEIKIAKLEQNYTQEAKAFLDASAPEYVTIKFSSKLGKYNLNNNSFPFTPLKNNSVFPFDRPSDWRCSSSSDTFPRKILLNINGGEFIKKLSIPQDKAETLIKTLSRREVIVSATVRVIRWNQYSEGISSASADSILHSINVINKKTGETIYEFPASWIGPKVAAKQTEIVKAEEVRRQKKEKEKVRKQEEAIAKADRIERGVEPLRVDEKVAFAHYKMLSSPNSSSYIVDDIDTRRPLLILAKTYFNEAENSVQIGGGPFGSSKPDTDITFTFKANGKPINIIVQNWKDFVTQQVPQDIRDYVVTKNKESFFTRPESYVAFTARPVGFMNDPWKGGKGVVVHVSSAEYAIGFQQSEKDWQSWKVEAGTPSKAYVQNLDTRTARELDIAGLHGAMQLDKVQDTLEDKLQLETLFDKNVKILESPGEIYVSQLFNSRQGEFHPGKRHFKGFFVQTGKSLMGFGSPIYSLKQAILTQSASAKERDVIIQGLIDKFGEPDLTYGRANTLVFTWGKRITEDRSNMPIGKKFNLPVSAVEAQIYSNGQGVLTILILTDELFLKKTKVTTKTIY